MGLQRMFTLRTKILLLFVCILGLVQSLTAYLLYQSMHAQVDSNISHELAMGRQAFLSEFESRRRYLSVYSHAIATDERLLRSVGTGVDDVTSLLDANRARVGSDLAVLTDMHGRILADTSRMSAKGQYFRLFDQIRDMPPAGSMFLTQEGKMYQVVAAPLMSPNQAGWIYLGFNVDDDLARLFEATTSFKVSFLSSGVDGHWISSASTLPGELRDKAVASYVSASAGAVPHDELLAGETFRSLAVPLSGNPDYPVLALLQRSMDQTMGYYRLWWRNMMEVIGATLVIAVLAGWAVARGLVRPLHLLVEQTRTIARGNYSQPIAVRPDGEVGELVQEFNSMQQRIAERESSIRYQADHDMLTGLANRSHFERAVDERIQQAISRRGRLSVVILDLNRFKEFNDTLGHEAGDGLLKEIGARIKSALQPHDLAARFGGDTFALLMDRIELRTIHGRLQALCDIVMQPYGAEGVQLPVSAAAGAAIYPDHGRSGSLLLRHADMARYSAKETYLSHAVYDGMQDRYGLLRLNLVGELRAAMQQGALQLHYQPQLDLERDTISSVEALVRWQHPLHGGIPPAEFIPTLERTGNIHVLTGWAIRRALEQGVLWRKTGTSVRTAVNISAHDLRRDDFVFEVRDALSQSGATPDMLTLEVTESAVMEDPGRSRAVLKRLRDLGISAAIDDYGTGYSSMTQLRQLPVDEVKIDKSFVLNVADGAEDELIVQSTIELAHNLHMRVTAEGVETQAGLEVLRELRCDYAQGYFVSMPQPPMQLNNWLKAYGRKTAAGDVRATGAAGWRTSVIQSS